MNCISAVLVSKPNQSGRLSRKVSTETISAVVRAPQGSRSPAASVKKPPRMGSQMSSDSIGKSVVMAVP